MSRHRFGADLTCRCGLTHDEYRDDPEPCTAPPVAMPAGPERDARDADIARRAQAGETYAAIGRHYGLTKGRARQIARRMEAE